MNLEPLVDKIRAFNFHVIELDGNNMEQVVNGLNEAHIIKDKPVAIIANTVKGKGVSLWKIILNGIVVLFLMKNIK